MSCLWLLLKRWLNGHDNNMILYSEIPPDHQTKDQTNPTLLVSWWATIFSLAIIITRLCGRYVRIERFFPEDKVMMASVVPLMARMALVHVILIWGTNNTKTDGMLADEIGRREIGSKLVLAARIFYVMLYGTDSSSFLKNSTNESDV